MAVISFPRRDRPSLVPAYGAGAEEIRLIPQWYTATAFAAFPTAMLPKPDRPAAEPTSTAARPNAARPAAA